MKDKERNILQGVKLIDDNFSTPEKKHRKKSMGSLQLMILKPEFHLHKALRNHFKVLYHPHQCGIREEQVEVRAFLPT